MADAAQNEEDATEKVERKREKFDGHAPRRAWFRTGVSLAHPYR
jgi:hypothetical protein